MVVDVYLVEQISIDDGVDVVVLCSHHLPHHRGCLLASLLVFHVVVSPGPKSCYYS